MAQPAEHWHLDKRVPIALIFTLFCQTAYGIWWASGVDERLAQIERRQEAAGDRSELAERQLAEQGQRIAVLTEAVSNTNRNLERLQGELSNTNGLLREMIMRGAPPNGGER